jgi:integrase
LDLRTLKRLVEKRAIATQHRIIAIKAFCSWLREHKFLLERRDDATLDLAVPQAVPEKHKRRKAVEVNRVRAALKHLAPAYRDCLLLLAHTGWHVSELERFVRDADASVTEGRGAVLGVLQVRHKIGHTTRTPVVDKAVLEAAKRLRDRGELPRRLNQTIAAACVAAGVETFTAGVMRHSVATWAIEQGTQAEVVAEFLGHQSKSTTLRFYADVGVPTLPIKLPSLVD